MSSESLLKIYDDIDTSGDGEIEYSEWIVASIDRNSLLTKEKLEAAFNDFD